MLLIYSFDPCEKMPILDFFNREMGIVLPVTEKGKGFSVAKLEPSEDDPWDLNCCDIGYGSRRRYLETWYTFEDYIGREHLPPCVRDEYEPMEVTPVQADAMKNCTITIDPEVADQNTGVRRPYYRLRGKPATIDEMRYVEKIADFNWDRPSDRHIGNFHGSFFRENGHIFRNGITDKYPYIGEYVDDALFIAGRLPFLDIIIAVTGWEECPDFEWDRLSAHDYEKDGPFEFHEDEWDFENNIDIGIYIHGGNVEILNPEHARAVYTEYDKKYGGEI